MCGQPSKAPDRVSALSPHTISHTLYGGVVHSVPRRQLAACLVLPGLCPHSLRALVVAVMDCEREKRRLRQEDPKRREKKGPDRGPGRAPAPAQALNASAVALRALRSAIPRATVATTRSRSTVRSRQNFHFQPSCGGQQEYVPLSQFPVREQMRHGAQTRSLPLSLDLYGGV